MSDVDRIRGVMARILEIPVNEVKASSTRQALPNWDSLRHLDLVMEVEAEFGCSFTMEEMTRIASVEDFLSTIRRKAA